MEILDRLIASLDLNAEVKDVCLGLFHTGVWTREVGPAATLPKDALRESPPPMPEAGFLLEKSVEGLVGMAYSNRLLEAAAGVAAVYTLLTVDLDGCVEVNAADILMDRGRGRRVVVVGHFPFISRLREVTRELWVIEKTPRTGDFEEDHTEHFLPSAEVAAITGAALTNHTLPGLLKLCDPKAFVIPVGDSAPLSPVLFDVSADAVCGSRVTDPQTALRCIRQGANYRQIRGVRRLTMFKPRRGRRDTEPASHASIFDRFLYTRTIKTPGFAKVPFDLSHKFSVGSVLASGKKLSDARAFDPGGL